MPLLLKDTNGGGEWKEHHVSYHTGMQRQGKTKEGSTALFEVIKEKMDKHADAGNLIDDREKEDQ